MADCPGQYTWSEAEMRVVKEKGFTLKRSFDFNGRVRSFTDTAQALWVLKSVDANAQELDILRYLASVAPLEEESHTVPAEIIPCGGTALILMPYVWSAYNVAWVSLDEMFACVGQFLEGLSFMHRHGVAHLDIDADNFVYAKTPHVATGPLAVHVGKAYFIDFGCSRRFRPLTGLDNGHETVERCELYAGHHQAPEGREEVNPYAYDVYSMGCTVRHVCRMATFCTGIRVPPTLWALATTLTTEDPRARPSAVHGLALLRLMRTWVKMTRWLAWVLPYHQADAVELCGWNIISWIVHCAHAKARSRRFSLRI